MFSFVIKRLLQAILVMLIVTLIAFLLFQFVGDPVTQMLGQEATEADRLALTHELGLISRSGNSSERLSQILSTVTLACHCAKVRPWLTCLKKKCRRRSSLHFSLQW